MSARTRTEDGGLTVAGLRASLEGAPDDALVFVHDDDTGGVLAVESAYDDGPGACADDDRHCFRIIATTDVAMLEAAAEQDASDAIDQLCHADVLLRIANGLTKESPHV